MKYLRAAARTLAACALLPNTFGSRRLRRNRSFSSGEDFNEFSKLARAEPDAGCGKINGTAKLAVSQFQLRLLRFWPPVVGKRVQQIRHLAFLFFLFLASNGETQSDRTGPEPQKTK